jgi:tetratricopeptide (TPR) repeat protein
MQPFTLGLAREQLTPQQQDLVVAGRRYRVDLAAGQLVEGGDPATSRFAIAHVMGGKNVYYFLTPKERGRLQVLPVAYDLRQKEWYDVAASGLRHFGDVPDQALPWTEREFTFNSACHGCHVSQRHSHYDPATDSYRTTWSEPGINCETCHGPGEEHVRLATQLGPGTMLADPKLISTRRFSSEQKNDLCASCHARMVPITEGFRPGDPFFDSFDLVGVEDRDYYPDGRDLGENYTFTSWRQSPCARSGKLDCLHCHTSSGRYRWKERAQADQACLPCHEARARDVPAHSHHRDGSTTCVDCHMPKTEFARMVRSDHSMRPPTPAATLAFGSPNACNLCHHDKDAAWSDRAVAGWHPQSDRGAVLAKGELVAAARKGDWSQLSAMLAHVRAAEQDEVFAVALLRLLASCPSEDTWPTIASALDARSPWVRAAAAESAGAHLGPAVVASLLKLTRDPVRLPRVRAANTLSGVPRSAMPESSRTALDAATRELEASLGARPDDFASQYDLGRLYASRGELPRAIAAYEIALRLRPDMVAALVNVSLLYNATGRNSDAEAALRRALQLQPGNAAAYLDLGMLLGELGRLPEAESAFRACLREEPNSAAAAYNLAVVLFQDRPDEAVRWVRRASTLAPASPKYAYTLAFYLAERGDERAAIAILRKAVDGNAVSGESYALLGKLLSQTGRKADAAVVFRRAAADTRLPAAVRARFAVGSPR